MKCKKEDWMNNKIIDFYKTTSLFTDLGKYKDEAIDLWEKKCNKSLKELCHYLMSVTIHRVVIQEAIKLGWQKFQEYGNLSVIDFKTPMSEDDIFLTASSMFNEIFRRDNKGFYFERPFEKKLVLTCRYISVLTSAILKANNIPTRSRAGWGRYLKKNKNLDHWVNEYWEEKENRWIMFDMDDLYDRDFMKLALYDENKIAYEYLDFGESQFYSAAQMWIMYRKNPKILETLQLGSKDSTPEDILKYLFLDFWSIMNMEYNYKYSPMAFDKKIKDFSNKELREVDNFANLMLNPDENFEELQNLFNTPKYRFTISPLVDKENYSLIVKSKNYLI